MIRFLETEAVSILICRQRLRRALENAFAKYGDQERFSCFVSETGSEDWKVSLLFVHMKPGSTHISKSVFCQRTEGNNA